MINHYAVEWHPTMRKFIPVRFTISDPADIDGVTIIAVFTSLDDAALFADICNRRK
jgi:hypothetical protein